MAERSRFPTSGGKRPPQGKDRLRAIIVKDPNAPHYALVRAHDAFVIATAKSPELLGQMANERGYPPSEVRLYEEGPAPQSSKAVHDACDAGVRACEAAREIEAQSLLEVRDIKDAAFDAVAADRELTRQAAQLDAAGVSKEPLHETAYARASLIKDPNAPPGAEDKYLLVQEGRVLKGGRGTMELSIWAAQNGHGIVNDMHDHPPTNAAEARDWRAAHEHFSRAEAERRAAHPEMQASTVTALGGPSTDQDLQAATIQHGGEDGPEAALGLPPSTPNDSPGSSDVAVVDGPTESSDRGPSDAAVADGPDLPGPATPGPENATAAIDAVHDGYDSEAKRAAEISMRTFPDAHAAAERTTQIQKGHTPPKKLSNAKVLKRGGRK